MFSFIELEGDSWRCFALLLILLLPFLQAKRGWKFTFLSNGHIYFSSRSQLWQNTWLTQATVYCLIKTGIQCDPDRKIGLSSALLPLGLLKPEMFLGSIPVILILWLALCGFGQMAETPLMWHPLYVVWVSLKMRWKHSRSVSQCSCVFMWYSTA